MFRPFTPFRLFDIFRTPSGEGSTAPRVVVSESGLVTVTCQPTNHRPRVLVAESGTAAVSC